MHDPCPRSGQRDVSGHEAQACTPNAMLVMSHTLLQGRKELKIWHQGQLYRLQTTKQGKLILTK